VAAELVEVVSLDTVSVGPPGRGDGKIPIGEGRSVLDLLDAPSNSDGTLLSEKTDVHPMNRPTFLTPRTSEMASVAEDKPIGMAKVAFLTRGSGS